MKKDILLIDGNILAHAININDRVFDITVSKMVKLIKITDYKFTEIIILVNYAIIEEDNRSSFNEKIYKHIIKNNWDNLHLLDVKKSIDNSEDMVINYIISNPDITSFKLIGNMNIKYSYIPENKIIKLEP